MARTPTLTALPAEPTEADAVGGLDSLRGERAEVAERAEQWTSSFKPCNVWELWLVDRIAVESLRIERCTLQEMAMRAYFAGRAKVLWHDDRTLEAVELARGMAKAPEATRIRLEMSSQGCDWLLDRWRMLLAAAEDGRRWDDDQRSLAFDLLGRDPRLRSLDGQVPGDAAAQAELARAEIARLEERKANRLARVEAELRSMAEAGFGPDVDQRLRALRRYETQCLRRLEWAFAQFKKGRHAYQPGFDRGYEPPRVARPATEVPPVASPTATAVEAAPIRAGEPTGFGSGSGFGSVPHAPAWPTLDGQPHSGRPVLPAGRPGGLGPAAWDRLAADERAFCPG